MPFYARHGFEVRTGAPAAATVRTMWLMWRDPRGMSGTSVNEPKQIQRAVEAFVRRGQRRPCATSCAGCPQIDGRRMDQDVATEAFNLVTALIDVDRSHTDDELWGADLRLRPLAPRPARPGPSPTTCAAATSWWAGPRGSTRSRRCSRSWSTADRRFGTAHSRTYYDRALHLAFTVAALEAAPVARRAAGHRPTSAPSCSTPWAACPPRRSPRRPGRPPHRRAQPTRGRRPAPAADAPPRRRGAAPAGPAHRGAAGRARRPGRPRQRQDRGPAGHQPAAGPAAAGRARPAHHRRRAATWSSPATRAPARPPSPGCSPPSTARSAWSRRASWSRPTGPGWCRASSARPRSRSWRWPTRPPAACCSSTRPTPWPAAARTTSAGRPSTRW